LAILKFIFWAYTGIQKHGCCHDEKTSAYYRNRHEQEMDLQEPVQRVSAPMAKNGQRLSDTAGTEAMIDFRFEDKRQEQAARDIFIFCAFTGLAYSDIKHLTNGHIQSSFDGKLRIRANVKSPVRNTICPY
jgi:ribonuclease I